MPGKYQYDIELKSNVAKLLTDMKEVQDRLDTVEGKEYKIKLNVDEKKLSNVISNLEKMLDSLGKGTGDFKQFENLSKELSSIVSEVQNLSKAFGKVDDSGTKTLLSSIQNIDKSLSELSQHILNVNKNMSNIGGNTNGAVKQVENITDAYTNAAKGAEKLAEAQSKIGNKSNILSENSSTAEAEKYQQITNDTVSVLTDVGKTEDQIIAKIQKERQEAEANNDVLREHLVLLDSAGKVIANHWGSKSNVNGTFTSEQLAQANGGKIIHAHPGKASFFGGKDLQNLIQNSMYDQIKQVELIWGDSTLSVDKSTLTKESSSALLNIMRNVRSKLTEIYSDNQGGTPSQEAREHINAIEKEIFKAVSQKLDISVSEKGTMSQEVVDSLSDIDKAIIKKFRDIESSVVRDINPSDIISSVLPMKDVFQGDGKTTTDASTTAIKELEQVSTSAKDASSSKEKFADANKEVKASAESSSTSLDEERKKIENVGDSAEETKKKLDDVVFKPNTEGFDEIVSKLDIAKDKIEEISKITKSSVWSESQGEYLESYNIKYKNGTSEIRGESSNKKGSNVLRSNEVAYDAKVAEQEAKAVKEVWDKNVKAIQDYMDAVTKLNNLNAKDKGSGKYASQITLQEKNVEELKEKALEARTAITSMINPHDVSLNTWRDYLDVMEKFSQASLGSAESVAKLEDALRKMDFSSLESSGTKFDSQFKNLSIKPDGDHQFLSWTNDLKELNAKIDEYNSKVKYLKENNIVDGEQVEEVKKLREEIEETINAMSKTPQAKRGWTDIGASKAAEKVANVLKQNTKMSKEARDAIRAYYNELRSGNPSQPIDEILVKVNQLVQKERELGRVGKSFGEIFKEKVIYGGAAQLAGMVGFYDVINVGRNTFNAIKELDTALVDLKKTTAMNSSQLEEFYFDSNDVAKQMGVTTQAIIDQASAWSRLNKIGLLYGDI